MQIFYPTRNAARAACFGKFVDNGPVAPKGQRYGRALSGIGGNSRHRKCVRAIMRAAV